MNTLQEIIEQSETVKSQVKTKEFNINYDGGKARLIVKIRHDDSCGNGHNSFAITGDIYAGTENTDRNFITGGCIHEEIAKYAPEFKDLIQWHLMSANSPMHYIDNTLFHARTTSHEGKKVGEPVSYRTEAFYKGTPFAVKSKSTQFLNFISENGGTFTDTKFEAIAIPHADDMYGDNYTIGLNGEAILFGNSRSGDWYNTPFSDKAEALEFIEGAYQYGIEIKEIDTHWCTAVKPNLEYARSSAIWPDATLEQLQNRELLEARLPELVLNFKNAVESIGFKY